MSRRSRLFSIALLALSVIPTGAVQAAAQHERFTGIWQAKLKGTVICTLEFHATTTITGSMQNCQIHTDDDGNLTEAGSSDESGKPIPISNVRIMGAVLNFDYRDAGEPEAVNFELTLVGEGMADLVIKNAPVKIKPIRFTRTAHAK